MKKINPKLDKISKALGLITLLSINIHTAQAQYQALKISESQSKSEMASPELLKDKYLFYAHKQSSNPYQYIAVKRLDEKQIDLPITALNDGFINEVIGVSPDRQILYTYHKMGKQAHEMRAYKLDETDQNLILKETRQMPALNNRSENAEYYLMPDGLTMLISAEYRPTVGRDDIYEIRYDVAKNTWSKIENLGKVINSKNREFGMYMRADTLFYSSDRSGEVKIYYSVKSANGWSTSALYSLPVEITQGEPVTYYRNFGEVAVVTKPSAVQAEAAVIAYEPASEIAAKAAAKADSIAKAEAAERARLTALEAKRIAEEKARLDAIAAEKAKVPVAEKVYTVYYNRDEYFKSHPDIDRILELLADKENFSIELIGYADAYGDPAVNERVSQVRAEHIANLIKVSGYKDASIQIKKADPTTATDSESRKVEVYILQKKQ
ncbi:OmpA family protein [Penaeicola halotolerans]|uniref:OmpA family protein n=1 Tax=Penaeicola halotolerans TaxID=2793196 RepID=UPI001CF8CEC6|nr:hypothetical protein [Penaeicola halotolerans]